MAAIQEIKSHDSYLLEQEAIKKQRLESAPEKATRHIKVYESSGYKYKSTPMIMLKGDWLKNWGFDPGDKLNIVCEGSGKLTITAEG